MINKTQNSGFTLIEVLVAIGIFSVMGYMMYEIVNSVSISKISYERYSLQMNELSKAIRLMESDFRQITNRKINIDDEEVLGAFLVNPVSDEEPLIEFSRWGAKNPLLEKRAETVRVGYGISRHPNDAIDSKKDINDHDRQYLVRYVWNVLDRGDDVLPERQVLLSDISSLEVYYLNEDKEWLDEWPEAGADQKLKEQPPFAVKVRLLFDDSDYIERIFNLREIPKKP